MKKRLLVLIALCLSIGVLSACGVPEIEIPENIDNDITSAENKTENEIKVSSRPYYEMPFSYEDFKIAGHGVADGDKRQEIYNAYKNILPIIYSTGRTPEKQWVVSQREQDDDGVFVFYCRNITGTLSSSGKISYNFRSWDNNNIYMYAEYDDEKGKIGENIVSEYPLLDFPVLPEMSVSDAVEKLQLEELIEIAKNNGTKNMNTNHGLDAWTYEFQSQFGNSEFYVAYENEKITYISVKHKNDKNHDSISFNFADGLLQRVEYRRYFPDK